MSTQESVEHLAKQLREDKDFYFTYQSSIAMSFYDEYFKGWEREDVLKESKNIHGIAIKQLKISLTYLF